MIAPAFALVLLAASPAPDAGASDALARAAQALGEGDFAAARDVAAQVPGNAAPATQERARLVWGAAARALGDFAGAARQLDFNGAHLGELEAYHQFQLGDARFYAGDAPGAVAAFTRARDAARVDAFAARAAGRLGDALLAAGQPCPAVVALQQKLGISETPERLDALARAQQGCGDLAGARDSSHRLWLVYAEHPAAHALEQTFGKQARPEDRLARAQRLFSHAGAAAALAEVDLGVAQKPKGELRARMQLLRARALFELKQRGPASEALTAVIKSAPKSDAAAEAQTLQARAAWRRGDVAAADALFGQLAKRRDRLGDEAAFLGAYLPFDKGRYADSVPRFEAFLTARPGSRKADEAAWFSAYASFRGGDKNKAHDGFERLAKRYPGSPLLPQALYWQGRTSAPRDAEPLYRATIRAAPLSYYAALARVRLAELGRPPEPPLPAAGAPPPLGALAPMAELARELSEVGLWADRGDALDAAIRSTQGPDAAMQLSAFCASLGEWGRAYAIANGRLWHRALEDKNASALAMLYPRAYAGLVEPASKSWGLDPAFAWAIMRRESAFDPSVESAARAVGLMQMLTPTAQKIAGLLGSHELPSAPDLHRPDTEVPLATWYLAELAGRFGHAALTAAAYNAGPKNVDGWLEQSGALPFDEFVEAIPFRETRLYVKNVVGDYLAYRTLYGDPAPAMPLDAALPPPKSGAEF